jgi:hypothetical protein
MDAKVTLILLVAFKRAMMLFLKDGVDKAVQELRAEESVDTAIAPQRHSPQASGRSVM